MTINKEALKRILIMRLGKIGDVLLTTPLLRNIRKNFPKAHITYIVGKRASPILKNNPAISELIISDRKIFAKIRKRKVYDLAIDLNVINITAQLTMLSGAKYRIAVYGGRWLSNYYNIILDKPTNRMNVVDYFLGLLNILSLKNDGNKKTEIFLSRQEKEAAQRKLINSYKNLIGIQPACDIKGAMWNTKKFAQLADFFISNTDSEVIIFQGPKEEKIASRMKRYMKQKAKLLPCLGLRKYLAILSMCDLFVANEGGQLHMSVAVDVPTVGIFGPGYSDYWFYYKSGFKKILARNISNLSVEKVIKEIKTF